jgi:uridine kinase
MRQGADPGQIVVPGLAEDLEALKRGEPVTDPVTRARIEASRFILFETQFGRWHPASGGPIDFLIWLDTPLDIALARKVRQFAGRQAGTRNRADASEFVAWLHTYLDNYLSVVADLLRLQRETVASGADLVIDGTLDPAVQQQQAAQAILGRFA